MHCKFLENGIAIAYQDAVKPCCTWRSDQTWLKEQSLQKVNFVNWHKVNKELTDARNLLAKDIWPENCLNCQVVEDQGRQDSIRLGGNRAYADFSPEDLTLEIRPGSVCNFACQTCWPPASSRVYQYHKIANILPDQKELDQRKFLNSTDGIKSEGIDNFDFLLPVADRLRNIVLLGGEPFYDPACLKFLDWWQKHTSASLIVFTNGSVIKNLEQFTNPITLVFSLDAVGKEAEYIRFGTDWPVVWENFTYARKFSNVDIRVNITTSAYNFYYFPDVIDSLIDDWPNVVTFGNTYEPHLSEAVIPLEFREPIINKLNSCIQKLQAANIEEGQKANAVNAVQSIVNNLTKLPFNQKEFLNFKKFVDAMDRVKHIQIKDYCEFTASWLSSQDSYENSSLWTNNLAT